MALSKEDLQAIKVIVDGSFLGLECRMDGLENHMDSLENHMDGLERRMDGLENHMDVLDKRMDGLEESVDRLDNRMSGLENQVNGLETHMNGLENQVDGLTDQVNGLGQRMDSLEADVKEIKVVQIENRIIPVLEEVLKYQKDVYERYHNGAELFEEKISLIDQMDKTVSRHSKQIQEFKPKKKK